MGKHYWEKTYRFSATATMHYEYICGQCGRTVQGDMPFEMTREYKKTAGKPNDLALTSQEQRDGEAMARTALHTELDYYKSCAQKENYDFLNAHFPHVKQCPFCHAPQSWAYRPKKGWLQTTIGAAAMVLGVLSLILFFAQGGFGSDLTSSFVMGLIALGGGALAFIAGLQELKKARETRGQRQNRPVIYFPAY